MALYYNVIKNSYSTRELKKLNSSAYNVIIYIQYSRMQRKVPSRLVCGSHSACLDSMLLGVWLGFFLYSSRLSVSDDSDSPVVTRCIPS